MSVDINQIFIHRLQPVDGQKTYSATIRFTSDGLSVFVNNAEQAIAAAAFQWANNCSTAHLEQVLLQIKNSAPLNEGRIDKITVLVDDEAYTLVPKSLFVESAAKDYLIYHATEELISNGEIIQSSIGEVVGLFLIPKAIREVISSVFKDAVIDSYNMGLLKYSDRLTAKSTTYFGCVSISGDSFDLLVKKRGQLHFFNRFSFSSKEDFIYFLLMTLQQLEIKPTDIELEVIGKIEKNSSLFDLMLRYFPTVDVARDNADYPWDYHRYCVEQKI